MKPRTVAGTVALVGWFACGCGSPNPIAPPSLPLTQTPIAGLTIGGMPDVAMLGQSLQLSATVTLTDGATKPVQPGDVTWGSDSASVATVSDAGVVSLVGRGEANIAAEFQGTRAIAQVIVGSVGIVHESAPTEDVTLSNVAIVVVGGRGSGYKSTSDAQGRFVIPPLSDGAYVSLTKDGYEEARLSAEVVTSDETRVRLRPVFSMIEQEFAGIVSTGVSFKTPAFPVYHDGEWEAIFDDHGAFWGFGYWLIERVSANGAVTWSAILPQPQRKDIPSRWRGPKSVQVTGGFHYHVRRYIGETTVRGWDWRLVWKRPR